MKKQILLSVLSFSAYGSKPAQQHVVQQQPEKPIFKFNIVTREGLLRYGVVLPSESKERAERFEKRGKKAVSQLMRYLVEKKPSLHPSLAHFYRDSDSTIKEGEPNRVYDNEHLIRADVDDYDDGEGDAFEGQIMPAVKAKTGLSKYVALERHGLKFDDLLRDAEAEAKRKIEAEDPQENPYVTAQFKNGDGF